MLHFNNINQKSDDIFGDILEVLNKKNSGFVLYPSPHGGLFYNEQYDIFHLITNEELKKEDRQTYNAEYYANLVLRVLKLEML